MPGDRGPARARGEAPLHSASEGAGPAQRGFALDPRYNPGHSSDLERDRRLPRLVCAAATAAAPGNVGWTAGRAEAAIANRRRRECRGRGSNPHDPKVTRF